MSENPTNLCKTNTAHKHLVKNLVCGSFLILCMALVACQKKEDLKNEDPQRPTHQTGGPAGNGAGNAGKGAGVVKGAGAVTSADWQKILNHFSSTPTALVQGTQEFENKLRSKIVNVTTQALSSTGATLGRITAWIPEASTSSNVSHESPVEPNNPAQPSDSTQGNSPTDDKDKQSSATVQEAPDFQQPRALDKENEELRDQIKGRSGFYINNTLYVKVADLNMGLHTLVQIEDWTTYKGRVFEEIYLSDDFFFNETGTVIYLKATASKEEILAFLSAAPQPNDPKFQKARDLDKENNELRVQLKSRSGFYIGGALFMDLTDLNKGLHTLAQIEDWTPYMGRVFERIYLSDDFFFNDTGTVIFLKATASKEEMIQFMETGKKQ